MTVVLATQLPGASGGLAAAATVAVACAARGSTGVLFVECGAQRRRGPTMLASAPSRELEERLRRDGYGAAARGRLCWVGLSLDEAWLQKLAALLQAGRPWAFAFAYLPAGEWRRALSREPSLAAAAFVHAALPAQRSLAALVVGELLAAGVRTRVSSLAPGRVGARRALAGIEAGGEAGRRAARMARRLAPAESGAPRPRTAVLPSAAGHA